MNLSFLLNPTVQKFLIGGVSLIVAFLMGWHSHRYVIANEKLREDLKVLENTQKAITEFDKEREQINDDFIRSKETIDRSKASCSVLVDPCVADLIDQLQLDD